ncbi:DUF4190 domain-containing protein [Zavarzinella formosa]|uniref:DUF4190 domain-containing protein n=1 Tax=Zavarzinella formosa TaxID=360055 RepID=UPI000A0186A5|nr:DUF4190 domain-containing protein [Zavarzinella formosa]
MPDEPVRRRPAEDDDDESPRPKRKPRPRVDDEDDYDDAPKRGRRDPYKNSGMGGLIPYKNGKALAAYYCGVFGLISCVLGLGIFGIVPLILGILGLKHAKRYPEAKGSGHAITGIVLGAIELVAGLVLIAFVILNLIMKR